MTSVPTTETRPRGFSGKDLPTACVLCSKNCGLSVDVENGAIAEVRADPRDPATRGYICNKGFTIGKYVQHAQRVTKPLRRRPDGTFEEISWDTAFAEIGAKLAQLKKDHSGESIAIAGIGGQGNHMDGPYASAFMRGLGSPWFFNALAQEKTQHPLVDEWVMRAPTTVFLHGDLEHAEVALVIGTNPLLSNRGSAAKEELAAIVADPARTLIVVDPRKSETAKKAKIHVALRPGSDAFFLLGVAKVILDKGLEDRVFVDGKTVGLAKLREALAGVDVATMARRAGIEAAEITEVAERFATAKSACIFWDLGAEQIPYSTLVAYLFRVLLLLTGNVGRKGGNVFLPTFTPALGPYKAPKRPRATVSGIQAIPMFGTLGFFSPNLLAEEIEASHPKRIRAVIVEGSNPLVQYAGTQRLTEAFAKLELLVVIDPAMTETARAAHYVLPTPVGYEKWEWALFPNGYPQVNVKLRPPLVPPTGDGLPEAEIYRRLGRAAGIVTEPPRVLRELARRIDPRRLGPVFPALLFALATRSKKKANALFWLYELLGPHLAARTNVAAWAASHMFARTRREDIARTLGADAKKKSAFALGELIFDRIVAHPEGVEVGRVDPARAFEESCRWPDGRARLVPAEIAREIARAIADERALDAAFPLLLNAGERTHWNANTIQRDPGWRKGKGPHCRVTLHPEDAHAAGISPGETVRVVTRAGAVELPAVVSDVVLKGQISIPNGFGLEYPDPETGELRATGVRVNLLTDARDRDPFTGCPHYKSVPARVERVAAA